MDSRPASSVSLDRLAQVFNLCFANYIGTTVNMTGDGVSYWCDNNYVSMERSHVFFPTDGCNGDEPVAFGLIAVRDDKPKQSRLAAMGVVPSYRRKGTGYEALAQIISAEKQRGTEMLELECIQQNEPALRLYKRMGFTVIQELLGWTKDPIEANISPLKSALEECTIEEVGILVRKHSAATLPWQAWGFDQLRHTERAFKLGHAYCAMSNPYNEESDTIRIMSLFVEPKWRRRGEAKQLAEALMAKFPGKGWTVSPTFPKETSDGVAASLGFSQMELSQYQMKLDLD